jgi:predicted negative regulator of RcsB-dependent stress response
MNERQSVAGAYQKIESHEELCVERYDRINEKLGELTDGAKTQNRLMVSVLLALLGWMALQLWNGQVVHPPTQTSTQTQTTTNTQTTPLHAPDR